LSVIVAAAVLFASTSRPALALTADSADDVCPASADPCQVTSIVNVADRAVLDFGTRAVSLSGNGSFHFGSGSARILCGPFDATSPVAIDAKAFDGGKLDSGTVRIHARRTCSGGSAPYPCLDDTGCGLGSCSVRRCSEEQTRVCTTDSNCQLGTCNGQGRCSGFIGAFCATNSDCDLGSCTAQLSCARRPYETVECSSDEECTLGSCSVGTASISIDGSIVGRSAFPAVVVLRAADSVSLSGPINLSGSAGFSDGGELQVDATKGSVWLASQIRVRGGPAGAGGDVDLSAGEDISIEGRINLNGGNFDGGVMTAEAGRDLRIDASVLASSTTGEGYGGALELDAGRDLLIGAAALTRRIDLRANGHIGRFNEGGDGGDIELTAARDVVVHDFVRMHANGARLRGGGDVEVLGNRDVVFDGSVAASASGPLSFGGAVRLDAIGVLSVGSAALFEIDGDDDGGFLEMRGDAGIDFAGTAIMATRTHPDSAAGVVTMDSNADVSISGAILIDGPWALVDVDSCRIELAPTAIIQNGTTGGETNFTAAESIRLLAGSSLQAPEGYNDFWYRTDDKPPLIAGTVSPEPLLMVIGGTGCPVCGNSEIDYLETCDDGNVLDGDGCTSLCQTE
jgi:cysteine-rich repeat protein